MTCLDITSATKEELSKLSEVLCDSWNSQIKQVMDELDISEACANDVLYLRTRSRHSDKLEKELIKLHREGKPPNMCDFGVTKESQEALFRAVRDKLACKYKIS